MLHLASETSDQWATWAVKNIQDVLLDHAHCEKKAASTAIGLIFRYPHHGALVLPLSRLAREELAHFEEVLAHISRRQGAFRRMKPSPYAARLMEFVREREPGRVVDSLLCCALIEARSCERMKLLADALGPHDPELAALYRGLLASEARHHNIYVDLTRSIGVVADSEVTKRLEAAALHEADVISRAPWDPRLHNGV